MFGLFGRSRWGGTSLIITFVVIYVIWAGFVRPFLIQVANYYWWMRP